MHGRMFSKIGWSLVAAASVGSLILALGTSTLRAIRAVGPVTFHDQVSQLLQDNCQTCHRVDGIAPFPLEAYAQAFSMRDQIYDAVESRRMPPWFADPEVGTWANDRSLSEEDRLTLLAWIRQGAPEGDPAQRTAPISWPAGWSIGEPDKIVRLESPVQVPAQGVVPYRYEYVSTDFPEDRWIQAMEIRPTAPNVAHHVVVLVEDPIPGVPAVHPRSPSAAPPGFGLGLDGFFAAQVPGHRGVIFPPGQAKLLPKGATLKFQLHYTPDGRATEDQTEIGFIFADEPPEYRIETGAAMSMDFAILPGARNHGVTAVYRFSGPSALTGFLPHMHLRGKAFRFELHYPDGRRETVLNVPSYDFNWQEEYILKEPIEVPAGTWLRATGWFDNSRNNPFNPDPTQTVRFGEQTYEEMMNGYFHYLVEHVEEEGDF